MRLTPRDTKLVRDLVLSHVLSRDQIIGLGYFSSVTRANTRLRQLTELGLVKRLATPFFGQSLYCADSDAAVVLGQRMSSIFQGRTGSPRFLQHALSLTNVRMNLLGRGARAWRFEQQARTTFVHGGKEYDIRPDGLAVMEKGLLVIEADLGHVAPAKFHEKLISYTAFIKSGECIRAWHSKDFAVLAVTTGHLRAKRLAQLMPKSAPFEFIAETYDQLGISLTGGWS